MTTENMDKVAIVVAKRAMMQIHIITVPMILREIQATTRRVIPASVEMHGKTIAEATEAMRIITRRGTVTNTRKAYAHLLGPMDEIIISMVIEYTIM